MPWVVLIALLIWTLSFTAQNTFLDTKISFKNLVYFRDVGRCYLSTIFWEKSYVIIGSFTCGNVLL